MPTTDFITWLERFGFPVAVVLALALAAWRISAWLGERVIVPLATNHVKFLEEATKASASNAASLEKLTELAERTTHNHAAMVDRLENHGRLLEKLADHIETCPAQRPPRKTQTPPTT